MRRVHESNPLSLMAVGQDHFSRNVTKLRQLRSTQSYRKGAGPQHHCENLLRPHPKARLCDRFGWPEFNSHFLLDAFGDNPGLGPSTYLPKSALFTTCVKFDYCNLYK